MSDQPEPSEEERKEAEEAEIVSGLLSFHVNGREIAVPELKWRADREWQKLYIATSVRLSAIPALTPEGQQAIEDAERELVLAYDQTHVLGDLEDATIREIDLIYNRLVEVAFPLGASQMTMMLAIIQAAIEKAREADTGSPAANSTSGPSRTGTSEAPTTSKPPSRIARSSSSTRRRRNA